MSIKLEQGHVYYYSEMLRKITSDLGIKDVDLAVGIGVTPATISNWKNSKSLPYEKDIKKLTKYLIIKLESQDLLIEHIDKYFYEVEGKISESSLKNIITAKNQGKYRLVLFLLINSLCKVDRTNKSIKVSQNSNPILENKDGLEDDADTKVFISDNTDTGMVAKNSLKMKKMFYLLMVVIIVFCIAIISLIIPAITQRNTISLGENAFAWSGNDNHNLATTGIQMALDKPLNNYPDYYNNLHNLQSKSDEQAVLKFGYIFTDIQAKDTEGKYFNYTYPFGKESLHGGFKNSNYMSCYIYLTKVAVAYGRGEIPIKAATTTTPGLSNNDVQALNDYFSNGRVGGCEWRDILGKIGIDIKNLKPAILHKYKKIFVFGLALHSATDVFRHSAFEKRSGSIWTLITHNNDDRICKSLYNEDNPYYIFGCNINNHVQNGYSDRYYAAEQIARKVIASYANETEGTIFDFGLPFAYILNKNFKIGNYCEYAKSAGLSVTYSVYQTHFEAGNYTIK